jgi:hypothetical protein
MTFLRKRHNAPKATTRTRSDTDEPPLHHKQKLHPASAAGAPTTATLPCIILSDKTDNRHQHASSDDYYASSDDTPPSLVIDSTTTTPTKPPTSATTAKSSAIQAEETNDTSTVISTLSDNDNDDDDDNDSDDDDSSEDDEDNSSLAQIQQRFERRRRTFLRITAHKSQSYGTRLWAKEELYHAQQLASYYDEHPNQKRQTREQPPPTKPSTDTATTTSSTTSASTTSRLLLTNLFLESHHSSEAIWMAWWFCWGHMSIYILVEYAAHFVLRRFKSRLLGAGNENEPDTKSIEHFFYFGMVVLGFAIMRVNGYWWEWLSCDSYRLVKFASTTSTAKQQQQKDTTISQPPPPNDCIGILCSWLPQPTQVRRFSNLKKLLKKLNVLKKAYWNLLCFYLIYLGAAHFYVVTWAAYETWILAAYASLEAKLLQSPEGGMPTTMEETAAMPCAALMGTALSSSSSSSSTTHYYILHAVCEEFHNPDLPVSSLVFNGSILLVSALAMATMGGDLFEM